MSLGFQSHVSRKSAGFQTMNGFRSKLTQVDSKAEECDKAGIVLDVGRDGKVWCTPPEDHVFITGTTGAGKTRRLIVPSVHMIAAAGNSMVITDPKGEIYGMTAGYLKKNGYEISVLDFRSPATSTRWNPLAIAELYWERGDVAGRDRALMLIRTIADMLSASVASDRDRFWEETAKSLFTGFAQYLLLHGEKGQLSFEAISDIAFSAFDCVSSLSDDNPDQNNASEVKSRAGTFWYYYHHLRDDDPIKKALAPMMISSAHQTFESIRVTFESMMAPYVNQKGLCDMMCESQVNMSSLARDKSALFIVIPDDESTLYPVIDIMIDELYTVLIDEADRNGGKLEKEVFFLLDEFGTLVSETRTIIPGFASMMSASRSRGIRFAIVCQSVMQLVKAYGDMAAVIMENCRTWAVLASRSHELTLMLQRAAGVRVSEFSGKEMQLFSEADLRQLQLGEVLILNDNGPYLGHITDISEYGFDEEAFENVPRINVGRKMQMKNKKFRWYPGHGNVSAEREESDGSVQPAGEVTYDYHLGSALRDAFIAIMLSQDVNENRDALLKRTRDAVNKFAMQPALKPYMDTFYRAYRHIGMMSDDVLEKSRLLYIDPIDDDSIPF